MISQERVYLNEFDGTSFVLVLILEMLTIPEAKQRAAELSKGLSSDLWRFLPREN